MLFYVFSWYLLTLFTGFSSALAYPQVQELQKELRESLDARQATEMDTW